MQPMMYSSADIVARTPLILGQPPVPVGISTTRVENLLIASPIQRTKKSGAQDVVLNRGDSTMMDAISNGVPGAGKGLFPVDAKKYES